VPSYSDHNADAVDAAEAVRALAHATARFDHDDEPIDAAGHRPEHPEDTYWILGDVLSVVRSLSQVVQQIGAAHDRNRHLAHTDDGSAAEGSGHAQAVHAQVHDALLHLEHVHTSVETAMIHSGKIAWHPPETLRIPASTAQVAARGADAEMCESARQLAAPFLTPGRRTASEEQSL
jgi:hypothetical protein